MSNQSYLNFLALWDKAMMIGFYALIAAAILVYV